MAIELFTGTLMPANLLICCFGRDWDGGYDQKVTSTRTKEFQTYSVISINDTEHIDRINRHYWILSAQFNPAPLNYDLRYLESNRTP